MTIFVVASSTGWLAQRNPVAKLVAATIPAGALVVSRDLLTPSILLGLTLLVVPAAGVAPRDLLRRTWPLLVAAVSVGVVNAVFGVSGTQSGVALGLRALAVALPGVLVLATTDPVDLADSLVQQLRVPAKFAYGTLAALRLLPLLAQEWDVIGMARRARGVEAGRSPFAALRLFASKVVTLLVVAIRRGTRLATAMDARGFDADRVRTRARVQSVTRADAAMVALALLGTAAALASSVALGSWRFLLG